MAGKIKVYAVKVKNAEGVVVTYIDPIERKIVESVLVAETNKSGEYLACTSEGDVFGYRHKSVHDALKYVASKRNYAPVNMSAEHPAVRSLITLL